MSWCRRGRGSCPGCKQEYSNRWKPINCAKCGYNIGGTRTPSTKKPRPNHPDAVLVYTKDDEKLFSVKTNTRDGRCFVVQEGTTFVCSHSECKIKRALLMSSGRTDIFSCVHSEKCNAAISAQHVYSISHEMVKSYQGDISSKEALLSIYVSQQPNCPFACRVSDSTYVVLGPTSTNNPLGYVHIKNRKEGMACTCRDSNAFAAKGKYERAPKFCQHLHALFCVGIQLDESELNDDDALQASDHDTDPSPESCVKRRNTVKLQASRKIPYHITPELLREIDERNRGVVLKWPEHFCPKQEKCCLCGSDLGEPTKHPGNEGKAFLITSAVAFKKVEVRIKSCTSTSCKAINQVFPIEIGLFNISDSVLVSLDIMLEWREHFKLGHTISNIITAKLQLLNMKLSDKDKLSDAQLIHLHLLLYNGFYCFEAMTVRNLDDVICGVCGTIGEVYLGSGNDKNCCSSKNIVCNAGVPGNAASTSDAGGLVSLESFLERITSHLVEKCVYTRSAETLQVHMQELPPIMAPALRSCTVLNTEPEKETVLLKKGQIPQGDAYVLAELIRRKELDMQNLSDLNLDALKKICERCGMKMSSKPSADKLRCDIHALYATMLVGLCPCHGYQRMPGKTGGFYHLVCRHGTSVASKFLTLAESVRDHADLYLSLKYPPPVLITESACSFARHMECRAPDVTNVLWGENSACFEKPQLGKSPNDDIDVPDLIPTEYRSQCNPLPDPVDLHLLQHPLTLSTRRYVLGDRFHIKSNPHKSPLCEYHDIDKCRQSLTIKTSYENGRKHQRRSRNSSALSFHIHFFFNYLMDFYQNEAIVRSQKLKLQESLQDGQVMDRDAYKRLIIRDKSDSSLSNGSV